MVKLKVQVISKCPKCGKQLHYTMTNWGGSIVVFVWCPDSTCRYARIDRHE